MRPNFPKRVRLVEVGPRDGLQNQAQRLSATQKIELIERLAQAGLDYIEAGSFVHPRWVPQMADSDQVLRSLSRRPGDRKSTRLNSSHVAISYAVFCLKKKTIHHQEEGSRADR